MTQVQLYDLITKLCREVGNRKGIKIESSLSSIQPAGTWGVDWEQKGQEHDYIVTLTYWLSPDEPHDEKIELPSPFHLTQDQREEFISSMIEKIDLLLKQSK